MKSLLSLTAKFARIVCLVALVLVLSGCRSAVTEAPAPDSGCYGFVRQGALVLNCSGQTQTTSDLGVQGFAVSLDGNHLALKRSRDVPLSEYKIDRINESKLVDLRTKTTTEIQFYPDVLMSSCGKLVGFDKSRKGFDLVTGTPLLKMPYTFFRCNRNESVMLGYTDTSPASHRGRSLMTGYPPSEIISAFSAYLAFDVSPNGEYIAFSATDEDGVVDRVCIAPNRQSPHCATGLSISGTVSVSDSGQVLFEQHTRQECVFDDHWHFAPNTEKKEVDRDACVGISRWSLGLRESQALEPLGREPQWIPNASLLREWMRQGIKL